MLVNFMFCDSLTEYAWQWRVDVLETIFLRPLLRVRGRLKVEFGGRVHLLNILEG